MSPRAQAEKGYGSGDCLLPRVHTMAAHRYALAERPCYHCFPLCKRCYTMSYHYLLLLFVEISSLGNVLLNSAQSQNCLDSGQGH